MEGFPNLSGITIQRLEKPKPKPELQNKQRPEIENSFEDEESSEEYYEDEEEEEEYYGQIGTNSTENNFKPNINDSITFDNVSKKHPISIQNPQCSSIGDSVQIHKTFSNKRIIDTAQIHNFAQNVGNAVTIDKYAPAKQEVPNIRQNLGDAIKIEHPQVRSLSDSVNITKATGKRIIDTSEALNMRKTTESVSKRIVDISELHNFTRNFADIKTGDNAVVTDPPLNSSISIQKTAMGNKRVLDVRDLQNFKQNFNESATLNRSGSNKNVLDVADVHSFIKSLDKPIAISEQAAPTLNDFKNNQFNAQKQEGANVNLDISTSDRNSMEYSDTENEEDFYESDLTSESSEEQESKLKSIPSTVNKSMNEIPKSGLLTNEQVLSTAQMDRFNQQLNKSVSFEKMATPKRVLNTNDIHNIKKGLENSLTSKESFSSKHKLDSAVTLKQLKTPNMTDTTLLQNLNKVDDSIKSFKRVLNTSELQNFKWVSNESLSHEQQATSKGTTESPNINRNDLVTINQQFFNTPNRKEVSNEVVKSENASVTKQCLNTSELQNFKQILGNSVSFERKPATKSFQSAYNKGIDENVTSNEKFLEMTEAHNSMFPHNKSVTFERTRKQVIDTSELQNYKKNLSDLISLERVSNINEKFAAGNPHVFETGSQNAKILSEFHPTEKSQHGLDSGLQSARRVLDTTQLQNLRDFDNSVSLERFSNVKHSETQNVPDLSVSDKMFNKLPTEQIQNRQIFQDSKHVLNFEDGQENLTQVLSSKPVIDTQDIQNIQRSLGNSVQIEKSKGSQHLVDSGCGAKRTLEDSVSMNQQAATRMDNEPIDESCISNSSGSPIHDAEVSKQYLGYPTFDEQNFENTLGQTASPDFNGMRGFQDEFERSCNTDLVESPNLKRSFEGTTVDSMPKKPKMGENELEGEKPIASASEPPTDEEISEYGSASDIDSENELDSEMAAIKREATASFNNETKIEATEPSFLENLDGEPFVEQPVPDINIKTEVDSSDTNDYDYDIKEKLKEMGEISFETVKKGDKVKKGDAETEGGIEDAVVIERKGPGGGVIASSMMRRNIREVMDETKLDESTLAAQRQEMERLQRVQEQQRLIRDVQRQMAQERMQNKVLSLLQGGTLSKTASPSGRMGSTVLVKLPNGETKPMTKVPKQSFDLLRVPKGPPPFRSPHGSHASIKRSSSSGPGQLTPSVSIAPVSKKLLSTRPYSDSEGEYDESRIQRPYSKMAAPKPSTLTTTEGTSDDDCIVVSDSEVDQAIDDEIIEDPSNSGMHTNDDFNQPDEQGRVVVNIGHPEGEPDIHLAPQIARIIKPHQIGGIRFLYDNVIESVHRFDSSTGFGCILAHSMGLGKTLQVVSFSDIFLRHTSAKTILCIMPINTLQNWLAEYNMWLPSEEDVTDNPLNTQGEVRPRTFSLYVLNDSHKTLTSRSRVVHAWNSGGGVLLIGYEQYRLLSLRKQPKSRRKVHLVQPEDEDKNKKLLDEIHSALVMPGPDLVICDEGHRIKNSHASISQALKQMRTKRRVVLTGYPLQNNLMEYWCMVDFARPNYLGSKAEFCNMFERPIQNGQCMDSTDADIKLMRYRAHVLHSLLVGFVQRRSHEVLQNALPQKEEYVLLLRMTDFQRKLYNVFMNEVVRCQSVPNPLKAFAVCCKIWNHPDVLYNFLKKRAGGDAVDIDLEEVSNTSNIIANAPASKTPKRQPRRGATPKGRRNMKPAASVTPNNTREEEKPPVRIARRSGNFISPNPVPDSSDFFHNENANFPSPLVTNQHSNSSFMSNQMPEMNMQPNFTNQSFSQSFSNFSNTSQASTSNTFQNIKQQLNLWESREVSSQGSNFSGETLPWQNDNKPSLAKNDLSSGYGSIESKPKINIISDIKLGNPFANSMGKTNTEMKKINIISDIKLDIKKEEMGEDKHASRFNMDGFKNEIKSLAKHPELHPRQISEGEDVKIVSDMPPPPRMRSDDAQDGIPYDWAIELLKDYIPGCIEYSAKTEVLFCILRESIALGDRLLLFSQSLITLDVIEQFLQTNNVPGETEKWAKNINYYRLDGSTSALEREKLINEFNANPKVHLFLVSTRAGSLGINLVGANRVIVFDASWNPCHDTQAVCRVYRYGQRKPCFVYRFVMDHCLEKKIYDRQINKQGMSDRVVDECNPDSHVTMKDLSTLCFDDSEEGEMKDWSCVKDNYRDSVLQKVLEKYGSCFNKQPFQHESLLVDRKDKQLSKQEKRLAKKGYEREKQASRQPSYASGSIRSHRPVASVRPMLQGGERPSRWIPAEHWQRQGMTAQEMTLPLDVVIPTNQPDKGNIILKAGQKVLVLKSPKGVYMQLENGKIVAIKTAIKVHGKAEEDATKLLKPTFPSMKPPALPPPSMPLPPPKRMVRPFSPGHSKINTRSLRQPGPNLMTRMQGPLPRMQGPLNRMPGHPRKQVISNRPPFSMPNEVPFSAPLPKSETETKKPVLPSELSLRPASDEITIEKYAGKNEKPMQTKVDLPQQVALLKSIQQRGTSSISSPKARNSTIQQLEQSTSTLISETKQRIHDINEITGAYQEEEKVASASDSSSIAHIESDDMQDAEEPEDIEDLDESYEDEELHDSANSEIISGDAEVKGGNIQNQEYNYNNYYPYNQGYSHPPPHQGYTNYPPPPPYDYAYGQPQQPPYNYGMYPQGYHPPQPQYTIPPPQPYDPYAQPPHPQPMYGGYHPPYPQQYAPPPSPYPPTVPPPPHNYPDFQYNTPPTQNQTQPTNYYQNT